MNVEQLIEDGWQEKCDAGECPIQRKECFALGVRHAIAAMFPVVKPEDLKEGRHWVRLKGSDEWMVSNAFQFDYPRSVQFTNCELRDIDEIRRCPTPGDVGMGGV